MAQKGLLVILLGNLLFLTQCLAVTMLKTNKNEADRINYIDYYGVKLDPDLENQCINVQHVTPR